MLKPFKCPPELEVEALRVLAGEYDVPWMVFKSKPVIVDIGANIGSFACWAQKRMDKPKIYCFEPHPENIKYLKINVDGMVLFEGAVGTMGNGAQKAPLYLGPNHMEHSMVQEYPESIEVEVMHPQHLPPCDVLKIDTEGSEIDILTNLKQAPFIIMLEYHSQQDCMDIIGHLSFDYYLGRGTILNINHGTLIWIHKSFDKLERK